MDAPPDGGFGMLYVVRKRRHADGTLHSPQLGGQALDDYVVAHRSATATSRASALIFGSRHQAVPRTHLGEVGTSPASARATVYSRPASRPV